MKTSLEHLPEYKIQELKRFTAFIVECMNPDYVILFGSYARGDWVHDRYVEDHILYEYNSDYDILVITETNLDKPLNRKWNDLERRISILHKSSPVTLIQHSWGFVKSELAYGSYFFTDIVKEGIIMYDNGRNAKSPLATPENLDPEKVKERAKEEYDLWFESANEFLDQFEFAFEKERYKITAFLLHQAAERYYAAFFLVFTGYKPKIHNIEVLGNQAEDIDEEFQKTFPKETPDKKQRFKLLKKAYIDARYKKNYTIEKDDLVYLRERVEALRDLVQKKCLEKMRVF